MRACHLLIREIATSFPLSSCILWDGRDYYSKRKNLQCGIAMCILSSVYSFLLLSVIFRHTSSHNKSFYRVRIESRVDKNDCQESNDCLCCDSNGQHKNTEEGESELNWWCGLYDIWKDRTSMTAVRTSAQMRPKRSGWKKNSQKILSDDSSVDTMYNEHRISD